MNSTVQEQFPRIRGYLDVATTGLPSLRTLAAMHEALEAWSTGRAIPAVYEATVTRCRRLYAGLVDAPEDDVALGPQVSVLVGMVAASLPDGAEVVTYEQEFSSVVFPFLAHADRGIRVRHVPLHRLADEIGERTACVAFSLVQSATGEVAEFSDIREAAKRAGAMTVCDTTQAVGWMPVSAGEFDVTVCGAYKWLCSPHGTAFLTASREAAASLRPINAGRFAGESVSDSLYGPRMRLAESARRFDTSPAWLSWIGTAASLELFAQLPPREVRSHAVGLANAFRDVIGQEPADRPVVTLPDPDGRAMRRLASAGCKATGRAGRVRLGFHLWNDTDDVARAAAALVSAAR